VEVSYFKSLYTRDPSLNCDLITYVISEQVTEQMNEALCKGFQMRRFSMPFSKLALLEIQEHMDFLHVSLTVIRISSRKMSLRLLRSSLRLASCSVKSMIHRSSLFQNWMTLLYSKIFVLLGCAMSSMKWYQNSLLIGLDLCLVNSHKKPKCFCSWKDIHKQCTFGG
jgi:hypothetical protein